MRIGFIARNDDEGDIRFGVENGLYDLEYNYHMEFDTSFPERERLRGWLERYGARVSAVGCWGQDFISLDVKRREVSAERLRRTIEFAESMGAPVVMTGGGDREGDDLSAKLRDVIEVYKPLKDFAEEHNVRLCFYNCPWANCVTGPEAWDVVLPALPGVGIKFDPSHPYHAGRDPYVHLADYASYVYHFHVKEVLTVGGPLGKGGRVVDEPMAGMGDFDWGKFIGILYKAGYEGVLSIEPHSKTWLGELRHRGILAAKRYLDLFLA